MALTELWVHKVFKVTKDPRETKERLGLKVHKEMLVQLVTPVNKVFLEPQAHQEHQEPKVYKDQLALKVSKVSKETRVNKASKAK
jgi:hypothetical protein